jgi:polyhydroxyalkanoate synthesis repressor PhaR
MIPEQAPEPSATETRRIIKRYSNRKLYDTKGSTYVTLLQIAQMIRDGEDVEIIDNATKEDKTDVTLALIISEELRAKPRAIPLSTLKALIRHGGERILSQLRGGPIGRLIPGSGEEDPEAAPASEARPSDRPPGEPTEPVHLEVPPLSPITEDELASSSDQPRGGLRATLEHWQAQIDERIRAVLPNFAAFRDLEQSVKRLSTRLEALEKRIGPSGGSEPPKEGPGAGTP